MPPWIDGTIHAGPLKLHYYRTGGGKPPVVINHGAGDDGLCFTHVAKLLEADYELIMPDARGHGKSGSGKQDYSTASRVEDLYALIEALKLDHPVVGGHSLGADSSMGLAAAYPGVARGIFLEDPPIILPGEKFTLNNEKGEQTIRGADIGKMMARYMRLFKLMPPFLGERLARKASPTYPDDEIKPWTASKRRVSLDFLNSMEKMGIGFAEPLEVIKKITVPTLLFIGDRESMSIVSRETAEQATRLNPLIRVVHLAGASHDIRRTRFEGYLAALKQFLAEMYP
ncbi:MAG: alpha/beta hydrolase [Anaerolineales bacterium]|nr:alpha/beta hydrolase [Anaerolineae bacterium]PWB56356.1 MAG: alpha/beta hydrolase [Anaerolineales bacterium]